MNRDCAMSCEVLLVYLQTKSESYQDKGPVTEPATEPARARPGTHSPRIKLFVE